MSEQFFEKPILNSPYYYPGRHWELDPEGQIRPPKQWDLGSDKLDIRESGARHFESYVKIVAPKREAFEHRIILGKCNAAAFIGNRDGALLTNDRTAN